MKQKKTTELIELYRNRHNGSIVASLYDFKEGIFFERPFFGYTKRGVIQDLRNNGVIVTKRSITNTPVYNYYL